MQAIVSCSTQIHLATAQITVGNRESKSFSIYPRKSSNSDISDKT